MRTPLPRPILLALSVAPLLAGVAALKPEAVQGEVDFNRDVRPILANHCWVCHGQDKEALKKTGGISLDSFAGATAEYWGMRPIVPGDPDKSGIIARVTAPPGSRMPPANSNVKPLTPEQIEILRAWIKQGAEFRAHWAFVAPKMPPIPKVGDPDWARNDIDRFVLSRLEREGIKPEPEADKATLLRRLSLTLTGLPPTPQEVAAFLRDRRPDAYERQVDRLLASPRYGENQARYWLDAVRYGDTHGLHIDNERAIFPYRDWVIRAFNEDLPYDKFATWQLAGDLLPNPTLEQLIATGYIRLNPTTNEGGAIEAEFLAKNTFDRVDTTSTVFLGVTMQCAKCHDHKYDPFSQRDYYGLYAYFNSTTDTPLDGNLRLHEPTMKAPSREQAARLQELRSQMQAIAAKTSPERARKWAMELGATLPTASGWEVAGPFEAKDFESAFSAAFDPERPDATVAWRPLKLELEQPLAGVVLKENAAAYVRAVIRVDKPAKSTLRLGSDDGVRVWLNGQAIHQNKVFRALSANADIVALDLKAGENRLLIKVVNGGGTDGLIVGLGAPEVEPLAKAHQLAIAKPTDPALVRVYLEAGPASREAARYRKLAAEFQKIDAQIPVTTIAQEMPKPRKTYLLRRGEYDLPGEEVQRAIPPALGEAKAADRLGLANWIVSRTNPLAARVLANRIWQQHFGAGLVKSSEDFGSRGEWPSHPELLDYLACRFVEDGWSIKKLTRLILTSSAYRQSAKASEAKRQQDPENRLVSRGPRFRLDAEVIRDTALYVSGLLVETPGGRGDKPYQPPGIWEAIAYPISDTAKYQQDRGPALYRRTVYMFWKRTSPPPTMLLFDAPMRESCVVRRSRTNTPTQALATLNETGFFEAARAFAQRVHAAKRDDGARIDYAVKLATGRSPTKEESDVIHGFLQEARQKYREKPAEAEKVLGVGEFPRDKAIPAPEHAAWTLVCNLILNLDETLTQH